MEHKYETRIAVFTMHAVTSILYFFKPIEIYIYAWEMHPFTSYPTAKHPKHDKFVITDMREK